MTYTRPSLRTLVLAAVVATIASLLLAFSRPVDMIVDGERVPSDVSPVTTPTDVYVPLRTLGDALGAQTIATKGGIELVRGNASLRVRVGDTRASINGEPFTLAHAPFRVRSRIMIGLRTISRAFRVHATYNAGTAQIHVITSGIGEAVPATPPQTQ